MIFDPAGSPKNAWAGLFAPLLSAMRDAACLIAIVITGNNCAHSSEDDAALMTEFLEQVAAMQSRFDSLGMNVRCSVVRAMSGEGVSGQDQESKVRQFEIAKRGRLLFAIQNIEESSKDTKTLLKCVNDIYAIAISRSGKTASLQYLERLGVDTAVDNRIVNESEQGEFGSAIRTICGYMTAGKLLTELVTSNDFSIKKISRSELNGKVFVALEFEYLGHDVIHNDKYKLVDGELILDPSNNWAVTSSSWIYESLTRGTKGRLTMQRYFEGMAFDLPIASRVVTKYESLDNTRFIDESSWTVELKRAEVPEEEFFLAYYGLPEPHFDRSFLEKWGLWLIGGVFLLATGCWLTMRRAR
jgi:hypothetical protein